MRERWFGASRRRVPELAVEGDPRIPLAEALVLDDVSEADRLESAHRDGTPVVVRAASAEEVLRALARPEVASVVVPHDRRDLLDLDLVELTYGP